MITAQQIKDYALKCGADSVGIASIERFKDVPPEKNPMFVAPAAKSVIGLGFRVLRGSFRGVESGTQFYQLSTMGVTNIDMRYAPRILRQLICFIEDNGFEGVPQMAESDRRPASDKGTNPEMERTYKINARPVRPGLPAPDVLMDFNHAAFACGLGEMGMGGFFLTPEFGPFQRFAFILTDAELEEDPLFDGTLCDTCGKCIEGCPGQALSVKTTVDRWVGKTVKRYTFDQWQCSAYYSGAHSPTNPFLPPGAFQDMPEGDKIAAGEKKLSPEEATQVKAIASGSYAGVGFNYGACICGKSCQRECYIHLEEKGLLKNKFKNRFRTEEPWEITDKREDPKS